MVYGCIPMPVNDMLGKVDSKLLEKARGYKERIAGWESPVEFVNNMYGCHPDQKGADYFKEVYR